MKHYIVQIKLPVYEFVFLEINRNQIISNIISDWMLLNTGFFTTGHSVHCCGCNNQSGSYDKKNVSTWNRTQDLYFQKPTLSLDHRGVTIKKS